MTTKVVKALKYAGLFSAIFFTIISCEKEIESIGVNLVDNNNFNTNTLPTNVLTNTINVERVIANGLPQFLLGVYSDPEFGKLKASIVTQLSLPSVLDEYNYGDNYIIDSVIIDIPYQSTLDTVANGITDFSLDEIIGDQDVKFQLSVYELKTFLNNLDPEDPSKLAKYYSDKEFSRGETPFYSGDFKVNKTDTVAYIKRYMPDAETVYDIDTIKQADLSPSIKIPLDESIIQELFVNNVNDIDFSSTDGFQHDFRGLYIEVDELEDEESHLLSLDLTNAKMTIYYSNDEEEGADVDLNDNDVNGEGIVRVKQQYVFPFGTIKSNVLERDNSNSKASGLNRLYVQGAAGSIATIELVEIDENLADLQDNNWLITDANLIFYVDQTASSSIAPEQLFIYNYDDNEQLLDMMTEGLLALGGVLERDDADEPYRYVFKITDYISELLIEGEPLDLVTLGVKVYNSTDIPISVTDNTIKDFSWDPKGVVLYGHDESAGDKKIQLEISYTEIVSD